MDVNFDELFTIWNTPVVRLPRQSIYTKQRCGEYFVDYTTKTIKFTVLWDNPQKDVLEHLNRISYDSRAKLGAIKKMMGKIDSQQFQLRKVLIIAEKQIKYLLGYKTFLKEEYKRKTIQFSKLDYFSKIQEKINFYWIHYYPLRVYYLELPKIREKYHKLGEVIKSKDRCFECLESKTNLSQVKHRLVCEYCRDEIRIKSQNKMECSICLETHPLDKSVLHGCGNKHRTCLECYQGLLKHSNKCPICRGDL